MKPASSRAARAVYRIQHIAGRWCVGGPAVPPALHWHDRREAAVATGRLLCLLAHARGGLAQLVMHGVSGRILWERTYGADPRRSRG